LNGTIAEQNAEGAALNAAQSTLVRRWRHALLSLDKRSGTMAFGVDRTQKRENNVIEPDLSVASSPSPLMTPRRSDATVESVSSADSRSSSPSNALKDHRERHQWPPPMKLTAAAPSAGRARTQEGASAIVEAEKHMHDQMRG
jgi:hypothetical protein